MNTVKKTDASLRSTPTAAAERPTELEDFDPELAIEAIRSLREGNADEQREVLEFLMQALDAERPEGQRIFSQE